MELLMEVLEDLFSTSKERIAKMGDLPVESRMTARRHRNRRKQGSRLFLGRWYETQLQRAFAKKVAELPAKVRAGPRSPPLPTIDGVSICIDISCNIRLSPATQQACLF